MIKEKQCVNELTCKGFNDFIKNKIAIIDFFAEWSMPCLMTAPVIEELAEKLKEQAKFARLNIEDGSAIASKLKVITIPTLVVFKEGEAIGKISGALPLEVLEEKLKQFL